MNSTEKTVLEYIPQIYIPNIHSRRARRLRHFYGEIDKETICNDTIIVSIGCDKESALI